jgi:hypothetical protein
LLGGFKNVLLTEAEVTMTVVELEALLTDAYAEEAFFYARILEGMDRHGSAWEPGGVDAWLLQVSRQLEEVHAIEARLQPVKAAWHQTGRRPGPRLSALLAEVAAAIRKLQGRMEATMAELHTQQHELAPRLDEAIRHEAGCRAYRANLGS